MRTGIVILPEHRWWIAEPKWRAAEEYGFDHAWTYDHLGWRTLVDGPWFGAMPTLTAAAMVTSKIRLGTFVASPNFRHPVSFARELLTLDDVSDGRFTLGVGAGAAGQYDTTVFGNKAPLPKERTQRFAEFVELLDLLLSRDRTTFQGQFYQAEEARSAPGCVQKPRLPFLVAANGPKAMDVAARFGNGWVTTGPPTEDFDEWWRGVARLSSQFTEITQQLGRTRPPHRYLNLDSAPVYSLSSVECFSDAVGRAQQLGFTDVVVHWPRHDGVYAGSESVVEQIAADVLPALANPKN